MRKLSIIEMKTVIGGGEEQDGKGGDGGETGHSNRSACFAIVQYRHTNAPVFTRVANCDSVAKDGGMVLHCSC